MDQFLELLRNGLIVIGVVGLAALIALTFNTLREYLILKLGKETFTSLSSFADMVVRYIEQLAKIEGLSGEEKKEKAVIWLSQIVKDMGYDISDDVIDMAIEAAVNTMNALSGKTF